MSYTVTLDGIVFPVAPSKMSLQIKNQNKTMELINDGEVNILKLPGLTEISFELLLPRVKYPFAEYPEGFKPMDYYVAKLEALKAACKPFQFICSRMVGGELLFDTNLTVSLEEYEINEDAAEGLDLTVSIKLKQYRPYTTKILKVNDKVGAATATVQQERPTQSAPQAKTYTVKKGDTLWNIAKKYLGNGSKYPQIVALNKDKISNPNLIYPGQVLKLP